MGSILEDVKKQLGIEPEYTHFDPELILHINSILFTLNQLGVGPSEGYSISSDADQWESITLGRSDLQSIMSYVYLRVRLIFDPPQMGYLVESYNKQREELEWRLNVEAERGPSFELL